MIGSWPCSGWPGRRSTLGSADQRLLFQVGRLYKEAGALDAAVAVWTRVDRLVGAWNGSGPDTQLILWGTDLVPPGPLGRRGRG